jgi:hypothetical protein
MLLLMLYRLPLKLHLVNESSDTDVADGRSTGFNGRKKTLDSLRLSIKLLL